jgi:hypothetical protein
MGRIDPNDKWWWLAGGWRERRIRDGDEVHPSVLYRVVQTKSDKKPYHPDLAR